MTDESLTRSEIINTFGEDLGKRLIDAGFASLSAMNGLSPEEILKQMPDASSADFAILKDFLELEVEEGDGLEVEAEVDTKDEAVEEPEAVNEVVEVAGEEVAETEPLVEEVQPETAVEGTEGDGGAEGLVEDVDDISAEALESVETGYPGPPPEMYDEFEKIPSETHIPQPKYSIRVQRIMEANAKAEAERKRQAEAEALAATELLAMMGEEIDKVEAEPAPAEDVLVPSEAMIDIEGGGVAEIVAENVPEETVDEVTAEVEELGPEEVGGPEPDEPEALSDE